MSLALTFRPENFDDILGQYVGGKIKFPFGKIKLP